VKAAVQEIVSIFENKMLPVLKTSDGITAEIRDLDGKIDIQVGKIKAGMDKVVASLEKEMSSADEQFDAERKAAIYEALAIGIVGILLQIGLAGWLLRTILRPIYALRMMLVDMSQGEGDLTKRLDDSTKDELAEISKYFNLFLEKLHGIIKMVISTLLLKVCHKKQENQAAIFNKFSVDADQNAFNILVNLTPLIVN